MTPPPGAETAHHAPIGLDHSRQRCRPRCRVGSNPRCEIWGRRLDQQRGSEPHDVVLRHRGLNRAATPAGAELGTRPGPAPTGLCRNAWASLGPRATASSSSSTTAPQPPPRSTASYQPRSGQGGESVRVRIGMHTGTPIPHGGRLRRHGRPPRGPNRRRRPRRTDRRLQQHRCPLSGHLPAATRPADLGQYRLEDILRLQHPFQLTIEETGSSFPPLRTLGSPTRLPVFMSPPLGRDKDVKAVVASSPETGQSRRRT
jgi:hypothetical protein